MSKLDVAREQFAYLKFWLGVAVVTEMSLVGWVISREGAEPLFKSLGVIAAIVIITLVGFKIHQRISRRIETLEEL